MLESTLEHQAQSMQHLGKLPVSKERRESHGELVWDAARQKLSMLWQSRTKEMGLNKTT